MRWLFKNRLRRSEAFELDSRLDQVRPGLSKTNLTSEELAGVDLPLWLLVRSNTQDAYFALSNATAQFAQVQDDQQHEHLPQLEDAPLSDKKGTDSLKTHANLISFCEDEDLEVMLDKGEKSDQAIKNFMADKGVRIVGFNQPLSSPRLDGQSDSAKAHETASGFKKSVGAFLKRFVGTQFFGIPIGWGAQDSSRARKDWVYATALTRSQDEFNEVRLFPGKALLRALLVKAWQTHAQPTQDYVTGMVFRGEQQSVVVFFKANEAMALTQMSLVRLQSSQNPDPTQRDAENSATIEEKLRNYLLSIKLVDEGNVGEFAQERICLFDSVQCAEFFARPSRSKLAEFLKTISEWAGLSAANEAQTLAWLLKPYPRERAVLGMPESKFWRASLNVSWVICAISLGLSALSFGDARYKHYEEQGAKDQLARAQEVLRQSTLAHYASMAASASVPIEQAIDLARQIYRDGFKVEIDGTRQTLELRLIAKLSDESNVPMQLLDVMRAAPPKGCVRRAPQTNTQLSELYLTYECTSIDHRLAQLLDAGN